MKFNILLSSIQPYDGTIHPTLVFGNYCQIWIGMVYQFAENGVLKNLDRIQVELSRPPPDSF